MVERWSGWRDEFWQNRDSGEDRHAAFDQIRGEPDRFLTHDEFPVDEPVWFSRADIIEGRDTVVQAAMSWLESVITPSASGRDSRFGGGIQSAHAEASARRP